MSHYLGPQAGKPNPMATMVTTGIYITSTITGSATVLISGRKILWDVVSTSGRKQPSSPGMGYFSVWIQAPLVDLVHPTSALTSLVETAFRDIKGKLYPTIGVKKPGEHIRVNFGQRPFIFDINKMMKASLSLVFERVAGH